MEELYLIFSYDIEKKDPLPYKYDGSEFCRIFPTFIDLKKLNKMPELYNPYMYLWLRNNYNKHVFNIKEHLPGTIGPCSEDISYGKDYIRELEKEKEKIKNNYLKIEEWGKERSLDISHDYTTSSFYNNIKKNIR